jgi:hypothetical protein
MGFGGFPPMNLKSDPWMGHPESIGRLRSSELVLAEAVLEALALG